MGCQHVGMQICTGVTRLPPFHALISISSRRMKQSIPFVARRRGLVGGSTNSSLPSFNMMSLGGIQGRRYNENTPWHLIGSGIARYLSTRNKVGE
jgi:hypothetical protein